MPEPLGLLEHGMKEFVWHHGGPGSKVALSQRQRSCAVSDVIYQSISTFPLDE